MIELVDVKTIPKPSRQLDRIQHDFFVKQYRAKEDAEKALRIIRLAAFAYDYDSSETDTIPYYAYAAQRLNRNWQTIIPPKMLWVLEIHMRLRGKSLKNLNTSPLICETNFAALAAQRQAEFTQQYLIDHIGRSLDVFRAKRDNAYVSDHSPMLGVWKRADNDPDRVIMSGSLSRHVAKQFASINHAEVIAQRIPTDVILDSYLTNLGFVHAEYEVRWLVNPTPVVPVIAG